MTIPFTCPHCGVQTDVFDEYAGQTGPCFSCGKPITIPFPSTAGDGSSLATNVTGRSGSGGRGRKVLVVLAVLSGTLIAVSILVAVLIAMVFPAVAAARRSAQQRQCQANIEAITAALLAYEADFGLFPPAFLPDQKGKPMHSWRVMILPYLGYQQIYDQYDFRQPWDSPQNMSLLSSMPVEYACPADPDARSAFETNYMVIIGERTAFPGADSVGKHEISDGVESTILVVETPSTGTVWLEPADLDASRMIFQVNGKPGVEIGSHHGDGAHVATADGQAIYVWDNTSSEELRGMTTIDGNEPFPWYLLQ